MPLRRLPLATRKCRLIVIFDVLIILQLLVIVNFFRQTSPQKLSFAGLREIRLFGNMQIYIGGYIQVNLRFVLFFFVVVVVFSVCVALYACPAVDQTSIK